MLDDRKLRTLHHGRTRHEIELEPGGAGVAGHFLHHLKPRTGALRSPN
jgi:hypothetical protein